MAGRDEHDEGQTRTDTGLCVWQDAGTLLTLPHALAVAARVQALGGRFEAATTSLDEALAVTVRTGKRWYEPELHRLQGELLLLPGVGASETARAQMCFERAIALARAQQAKLFEGRATASLAQLTR